MVPASSARNLLVLSLMACSGAFRATTAANAGRMVPASSARNLLVLSLMACSEAFRATLLFVAPGKLVLLPQLRADTPTAADSAPRLCLSLPPITRRHCAPLSAQRYPCPYADCDAVEPAAGHKIWGAVELWDLPPLSAGLLTAWLDWEWEPGALGPTRPAALPNSTGLVRRLHLDLRGTVGRGRGIECGVNGSVM